jgi:hypothetical protein
MPPTAAFLALHFASHDVVQARSRQPNIRELRWIPERAGPTGRLERSGDGPSLETTAALSC